MERKFHKIIKEICEEEKISYHLLSKDWIIMLEKDDKTRFISGFKFDLNSHGLGNVVDDKYALFEVLKTKGISVIEHNIMFNKNNDNDYALNSNQEGKVIEYFKEHNNSIVLKANKGTCGSEVYHVTSSEDVNLIINKLFKNNFSISICPFYDIKTEYRVIMLDGKAVFSYGKKKPVVIGNGKKTLKELLIDFNKYYFIDEKSFYNKEFDTNYIPLNGEVIEYNWQFNLSKGSQIIEIEENIKNKVESIAIKTAKEINLGFGSVDVIETKDDHFYVLESNSGVMMENLVDILSDGYEIAKKIYKEAIILMFK